MVFCRVVGHVATRATLEMGIGDGKSLWCEHETRFFCLIIRLDDARVITHGDKVREVGVPQMWRRAFPFWGRGNRMFYVWV